MERRDMLSEYFSLHLSPDGLVESLPLLLRDYAPNLDKLPSFLMRLGPQVRLMGRIIVIHLFIAFASRSTGHLRLIALTPFSGSWRISIYQGLSSHPRYH